jgi:hypothetical protein
MGLSASTRSGAFDHVQRSSTRRQESPYFSVYGGLFIAFGIYVLIVQRCTTESNTRTFDQLLWFSSTNCLRRFEA